jgi:hypothetical protein|tara:strand:- start:218 stop:892 length:675 start_codon:yes stop_codon:yes gene_type:complete
MALNINGTTGISGVDGSVSAPALTGTDSNTGITFPAADTIKFSTGGVERMAITNSGITGIASGGKVLQVVQESKKNTASETVGAGTNDNSSGLTGDLISKAITPSNASNLILIRASLMVGISDDKQVFAQLFKAGSVLDAARGDSSVRQQVSAATYVTSSGRVSTITHEYLDTAGGTSPITYSYRFSHDSSTNKTIYLNRDHTNSATVYYVRGYSSLTLTEIEP